MESRESHLNILKPEQPTNANLGNLVSIQPGRPEGPSITRGMGSCQPKWKQIGCLDTALGDEQEEANFKAVEVASLSGERILSAVDAAIRKIEFLQLLPQLFQFIVKIESGDLIRNVSDFDRAKSLLIALGEDFVQDLFHLARCQKVWRTSKNGNVKKCSSPVLCNRKEDRDGEVVADDDDGPVVDERGHETCLVNPNGMSMSPSPSYSYSTYYDTKEVASTTRKVGGGGGRKRKPTVSVSSLLKKDKSIRDFLRDLLNSRILTDEETSAVAATHHDNDKNPPARKKSVVKLLKFALKGRYASHVRKCLKDRDLKSLMCILSIVADNDTENQFSIEKSYKYEGNVELEPPEDSASGIIDRVQDSIGLDFGALLEVGEQMSDSSGNDDVMRMVLDEGDPETLLKSSADSGKEIDSAKNRDDKKINDELIVMQNDENDKESMPINSEIMAYEIIGNGLNSNQSLNSNFPLPESDMSSEILSKFSTSKGSDSDSSDSSRVNKVISVSTEMSPERLDKKSMSRDFPTRKTGKDKDSISSSTDTSMIQNRFTPKSTFTKRNIEDSSLPVLNIHSHQHISPFPLKEKIHEDFQTQAELCGMPQLDSSQALRINFLYRKVLDRLLDNPNLVTCIKETLKAFEGSEVIRKRSLFSPSSENKFSAKLYILSPSNGLNYFHEAMKKLRSLMRTRLLFDIDDLESKTSRIKQILVKTAVTQKKIDKLESRLYERKSSCVFKFLKMKNQIEELETDLENRLVINDNELFEEVKDLETVKIVQEKLHAMKISKQDAEIVDMQNRLQYTLSTLGEGYRGLRAYRNELEKEIRRIIHEYDATVSQKQKILDKLSLEEEGNEEDICKLQDLHKEIEERYEEMRATKRLKELLQNLQMAESVKENWAARRIQAAWKRYKTQKLRKRRFKKAGGKKKQKKSSEDDVKTEGSQKPSPNRKKGSIIKKT